jgi:hypothetical protein
MCRIGFPPPCVAGIQGTVNWPPQGLRFHRPDGLPLLCGPAAQSMKAPEPGEVMLDRSLPPVHFPHGVNEACTRVSKIQGLHHKTDGDVRECIEHVDVLPAQNLLFGHLAPVGGAVAEGNKGEGQGRGSGFRQTHAENLVTFGRGRRFQSLQLAVPRENSRSCVGDSPGENRLPGAQGLEQADIVFAPLQAVFHQVVFKRGGAGWKGRAVSLHRRAPTRPSTSGPALR